MKLFALAFLLTLSSAFAGINADVKMASITSNIDTDTGRFLLITDEKGDIDSIRYTVTQRGGSIAEDHTYTWEQVRDGGAVLVARSGRDVVVLYVDKQFSPQTGGVVRINYLYSGVTGSRLNLSLTLVRSGNDFILKNKAATVNTLYIEGNWSPILGLVGISYISTSFKAPLMQDFDAYSSSLK